MTVRGKRKKVKKIGPNYLLWIPSKKKVYLKNKRNMRTWSSVKKSKWTREFKKAEEMYTVEKKGIKKKKKKNCWQDEWISVCKILARWFNLIFIRPQYLCPFPLPPLDFTCPQPSPWLYSHHTWEKCFINSLKVNPWFYSLSFLFFNSNS